MAAPKMLLVFCDGTGDDGSITENSPLAIPDDKGSQFNTQFPTNVVRLSRAIKPTQVLPDGQQMAQIVFYQSGVGSEADLSGKPLIGDTILDAFGLAVASKIRDAYVFIAHNYSEGDQICLFGGAYTARKVAGLIDRIGLLKREEMGNFFMEWSALLSDINPPPRPANVPPIKCVGVWETVGSIQNGLQPITDMLDIKDNSLPASVEYALHGLAMQENRARFLPTLWSVPDGLQPGQVLKQVWFGGAHSDVGGGYQYHALSDLALFWMAGEIQSFIAVDLDYLLRSRQPNPGEPWGEAQPHNSYDETANFLTRQIIGHETRLAGGQITSDSIFHESLRVAPTKLTCKDPYNMITLDDVKARFGHGWTPTFAPLNDFEQGCRSQWGTPAHNASTTGKFSKLETPQGFFSSVKARED
ncbi:hypothetical protein BOTBODRAFT_46899 [Botryobasidium botryosum FD-172 SS1]|uniref:T6SS Phospholipase effector Tle1-like catalytic domain-containing protein n=1 Tax=Botryobasidium botryosum (strain FD-172 SS1) TaxID=930990 RepID=A0A067M7K8_BOTB1|nr:hypothetical protein BOTBODRAFT_46899 [Botryobasidium botryosum FD-172 SS1]